MLLDKIEKGVPFPFTNCKQEVYDSIKTVIEQRIQDNMPVNELYNLFYPLIQSLQDAHFAIYPDNNPDTVLYFPYKVIIQQDKIYVNESLTETPLITSGDEIIAINNIPVGAVIKKIQGVCPGNQAQELFFERRTEKVFHNRLFYLLGMQDSFAITTRKANITVKGVTAAKFERTGIKQLDFEIKNDIAYLTINHLMLTLAEERNKFNARLDEFFEIIAQKNIHKLIIDIRGNMGGSSVLAKDVLDRITDQPYTLSVGTDYIYKGVKKYYKNNELHYPSFAVKHRYRGKVVLLSDVLTYSSAQMMQAGFKYFKMGTVIGNGSSESLHISGEIKKTILKNSKLELITPTVNFRLPGYQEGVHHSFMPDVFVNTAHVPLLKKTDVMLDNAIEYITAQ